MTDKQIQITPVFDIGATVYPRCDPNQYPRIVTGWVWRPGDRITYMVSDHLGEMEFNDFELSDKKWLLI